MHFLTGHCFNVMTLCETCSQLHFFEMCVSHSMLTNKMLNDAERSRDSKNHCALEKIIILYHHQAHLGLNLLSRVDLPTITMSIDRSGEGAIVSKPTRCTPGNPSTFPGDRHTGPTTYPMHSSSISSDDRVIRNRTFRTVSWKCLALFEFVATR